MTNTKKSLLTSALSMLLCVAMLLGTTFAWFTDSATNTGNRILAGNLKVDLLRHNGTEYESIKNGTGDIFDITDVVADQIAQNNSENTLWEPGKTQIVYLAVENDGNLALKYDIMLNVTDYGLVGALEYAIVDGAEYGDVSATDWNTLKSAAQTGDVKAGITMAAEQGKLVKGAKDYFALAVHMKEDAGNDYMEKDIIIDIAVNATQVDEEEDSFGTNYDAGLVFGEDVERVELPARATEKVEIKNNVTTKEVVLKNGDATVKATVPAGTVVEDGTTELVLNVKETDNSGFTVTDGKEATSVDISVDGIDNQNNNEIIIVEIAGLFPAKLPNAVLYHEGVAMNKVASAADVDADEEYYYDYATGDVKIATKHFSKFTVEYAVIKVDADKASSAIAAGGDLELNEDVKFSETISNNTSIDLNDKTLEPTNTINVSNGANLALSDGDYEVNGTYGHLDVRPTAANSSVVTIENVDFSYNKLGPTYGPSTNRLGSVLEYCPVEAGAEATIIFKNCTFDNAQVLFEGMSGKTGKFNATFENCTFNALTSSAPIYVQNYIEGTLNIIGCTFNLEVTSSSASAVSISPSSSTKVTLNASNNTINAVVATPKTSENANEIVKVNGTPANIKFLSAYANTTANVTGTIAKGIAVAN